MTITFSEESEPCWCYAITRSWQLHRDTVYIHKDKLGNKNLQFAQSVLRTFRVDEP